MRLLAIVAATLAVAACQVPRDPDVVGAKFVGPCTVGDFYIVELPKTRERVISIAVRPVNRDQIYHVAPGVNPFQACQTHPFTGTRYRRHNH